MFEKCIITLRGLNRTAYSALLLRYEPGNELKPIAVDRPPTGTKVILRRELPHFDPPFRVPRTPFQARIPVQTPVQLFLYFLGEESLQNIVIATNEAANSRIQHPQPQFARHWSPLTLNELIKRIGLLFYMGRHTEPDRRDHWNSSFGHKLGQFMYRDRWEQIHRYLTITPINLTQNNVGGLNLNLLHLRYVRIVEMRLFLLVGLLSMKQWLHFKADLPIQSKLRTSL